MNGKRLNELNRPVFPPELNTEYLSYDK